MADRALVIGIDDYTPGRRLRAAANDARAVDRMLRRDHDLTPRWSVEPLIGERGSRRPRVTREVVSTALSNAIAAAESEGGRLLLYFAGHCHANPLLGPELVVQGHTEDSDDTLPLDGVIASLNRCRARSVTVILDCCYSGAAATVGRVYDPLSDPRSPAPETSVLRENLALISASRGHEAAEDGPAHSPFTELLLSGLEGGAAQPLGAVTVMGLYEYVSAGFSAFGQRPQLKVNMTTEPMILRVAEPRISLSVLLRLTEFFPAVDDPKQLTPAHEGEGRPLAPGAPRTREQQEFDDLAEMRNTGLLVSEPPGRAHYDLAMASQHVRLSALGRWYWKQVKEGRL